MSEPTRGQFDRLLATMQPHQRHAWCLRYLLGQMNVISQARHVERARGVARVALEIGAALQRVEQRERGAYHDPRTDGDDPETPTGTGP